MQKQVAVGYPTETHSVYTSEPGMRGGFFLRFWMGTEKMDASFLDAEKTAKLYHFWLKAHPAFSSYGQNNVELITQEGDTIRIAEGQISLSPGAKDKAMRALVLYAKENWNNKLLPSPANMSREQHARIWAHCQIHGVDFGWRPSREVARIMAPEIERLRGIENNTFVPDTNHVERLTKDLRYASSHGDRDLVNRALDGWALVLNAKPELCASEELRDIILNHSITYDNQKAFDAVLKAGVYVGRHDGKALRGAYQDGRTYMIEALQAAYQKEDNMSGRKRPAGFYRRFSDEANPA
ncbi:MAG: hypothetical protein P4M02_01600 [Clostridia bacterium]|nr:hypothetical protein [Clostridia bacterium]